MKEILLEPGIVFATHVDVAVKDFPKGRDEEPRQRCKISVDYARSDVADLIRQGLDFDAALEYYRSYIYNVVKFRIASDWTAVGGMDETMAIVAEKVRQYY